MKHVKTTGIILSRTDYGEADRILTILTPDHGKLRLKARGVRKVKSKLAGGIELFSTSHITFIEGKGNGLGMLISTRLIKHYGHIVNDLGRVQLGYDLTKLLNRVTEDHPDNEYYELLEQAFAALDSSTIGLDLIRIWFQVQLLKLAGHEPNLNNLTESKKYTFDFEDMTFRDNPGGPFVVNDIKFLRLLFAGNKPSALTRIDSNADHVKVCQPLVQAIFTAHIDA